MRVELSLACAALSCGVIVTIGAEQSVSAGDVQGAETDDVERLQTRGRREVPSEICRSFVVRNDAFEKDGVPFIVRSGSLHYPRIPREYWRDRFRRVKALGINTITAYIFWSFHEEQEGVFDFTGQKDVVEFITMAGKEGFLVLLRPGPYICGEWDLGGLPWWLLAKPGIKLRTWNAPYIAAVDKFWGEVLPKFKPLLYSNGGPIVMVQLENEYGTYGNCRARPDDARYMYHLLDLAIAALGTDVVYTTLDGALSFFLHHGSPWYRNRSVVATVDGPLAKDYSFGFNAQKNFNAPGNSPRMWSELWVGWYSRWGASAGNKTAQQFSEGVRAMVSTNGSFSLYMSHGGTNFAMRSGARQEGMLIKSYVPYITSYDYSSPVSEQGRQNIGSDGGNLFAAVRDALATAGGTPAAEFPQPLPVAAYGTVELTDTATLFGNLERLQTCKADVPGSSWALPTMEELGIGRGLILYRRQQAYRWGLVVVARSDVRDRLIVHVNGTEQGQVYRSGTWPWPAIWVPLGQPLDFLIENLGHINVGLDIKEQKGLGRKPVHGDYTAHCLPLDYAQVGALPFQRRLRGSPQGGPAPLFMRGVLHIDGPPRDTYLDSRGLVKGYMWVNGHNLGRYWESAGPEHTLYVPAPFLRTGANEVIVLDLHGAGTEVASVAWPRWEPVSPEGLSGGGTVGSLAAIALAVLLPTTALAAAGVLAWRLAARRRAGRAAGRCGPGKAAGEAEEQLQPLSGSGGC